MKLSIIVPVHNVEKYLSEALDSVIRQTYKDWELILVENQSCDRSYEICLSYAEQYSNIRVCTEERADLSNARNRGIQESRGEYLMFLDSDDYLASDTIVEKLIRKIEKEHTDIVVCNYYRLWNGKLLPAVGHEKYSYKDRESEDFRFEGFFSCGNLSYVWAKIYRASFLKEKHMVFKEFEYAEDKMFNTECYIKGSRYAFIKERGYVYRRNEMSVSYQYNEKLRECWLGIGHELEKMLRKTRSEKYEDLVRYIIFFAAFFDAKMEYAEQGKSLKCIRYTLKRYGKDPLAKKCFQDLMYGKNLEALSPVLWKVMMRGFSCCMNLHMYGLLSLGIKLLIDLRIDERLSDTGLRE